jgi:hypothetical protein
MHVNRCVNQQIKILVILKLTLKRIITKQDVTVWTIFIRIRIEQTAILYVSLYGCETVSLTLRHEHRLRVLRRIFRPKKETMAEGWRRLHDEELYNLYATLSTIRVIKLWRMRWTGNVVCNGKMRRALFRKSERKRALGRLKHT